MCVYLTVDGLSLPGHDSSNLDELSFSSASALVSGCDLLYMFEAFKNFTSSGLLYLEICKSSQLVSSGFKVVMVVC